MGLLDAEAAAAAETRSATVATRWRFARLISGPAVCRRPCGLYPGWWAEAAIAGSTIDLLRMRDTPVTRKLNCACEEDSCCVTIH
ncbi:Protein of unknown function [Gryllus bimaculatus]|nr:Protein of unknown function [Gryllus bimaculatus]